MKDETRKRIRDAGSFVMNAAMNCPNCHTRMDQATINLDAVLAMIETAIGRMGIEEFWADDYPGLVKTILDRVEQLETRIFAFESAGVPTQIIQEKQKHANRRLDQLEKILDDMNRHLRFNIQKDPTPATVMGTTNNPCCSWMQKQILEGTVRWRPSETHYVTLMVSLELPDDTSSWTILFHCLNCGHRL